MDGGSETIDFERFVKISLPYNNEIDVLKTYLTDKVAWFLNHENFSLEIWTGDIVRPGTMHEMINQRERLQNNTTRGYVGSGYFMSYHNNKSACVFGLDYTEVNYIGSEHY